MTTVTKKKTAVRKSSTSQAEAQQIHALSELVSRAQLLSRVGKQYDNERDLYEVLGYLTNPGYSDYYERYLRQDIAKRINDAPVSATWRNRFLIAENEEPEVTEFEKAWTSMTKRLRLFSKFVRLDRLVGLGSYAVLLCGYNDVQTVSDFANAVDVGKNRELLYVQPYSSNNAFVHSYVEDTADTRYGLPRIYRIQFTSPNAKNSIETYVHHSRIIHVAEDLLESETEGQPRLQIVLNRLFDLEKIVGGSAEMFWRGARPGYALIADADADMDTGEQPGSDFQDELDEFEHNLRRWLRLQGVDVKSLAPQVADPSAHVDVQLQMISAAKNIPKRILIGSERGELASTQDEKAWKESIETRQLEYAEDQIVRPFIDAQIEYGVLPPLEEEDGEYVVNWPDLWEQGEKDKAEIGKIKTEALARYSDSIQASAIVPPATYLKQILEMSDEQIKAIEEELTGLLVLEE